MPLSYLCWRLRLGWEMLTLHSKMLFNRPDKHGNRCLRCSISSSLRSPYTIGAKHCAMLKKTKLITANNSLVELSSNRLLLRICSKNSIKLGRMKTASCVPWRAIVRHAARLRRFSTPRRRPSYKIRT